MPKVFCIGANKTGTTSLLDFFRSNGFSCGDQAEGERLFAQCEVPEYRDAVIAFSEKAEFFQDLPFSASDTYKILDEAFEDALFVMTRRSSAEDWYQSLTRFHAVKFGDGIHPPTRTQLKKAVYRYPGFMWDANRALYNSPPDDPYRKTDLIAWYENRLREARAYFRDRDNYLEIEISDPDAGKKISEFVGFVPLLPILPHLNRADQ